MKIITIMVFASAVTSQGQEPEQKPIFGPQCDIKIMQSLGLQGYKYPVTMSLEMCPTVKKSCCRLEDQLEIYKSWVIKNEEDNLEKRLQYHKSIYMELFKKTKDVLIRAKKTFELVEGHAVSNCKILSRRILAYRVDKLMPILRDQMDHMHDFLTNSYKGLYCTACDANMTQYFKIKDKKIVFGEKYCREIINNNLVVLIYFHHHFNKYLNMVTRFVTQCDYMGTFKHKHQPANLTFHTKGSHYKMLHGCNQYRNQINWLDFCQPICQRFSIAEFRPFFAPKVENFRKYTRWLGKQLTKIDAAEARDLMIKSHRKNVKAAKQRKIKQMIEKGLDVKHLMDVNGRVLSATNGNNGSSDKKDSNKDEYAETEHDESIKKEKGDLMLEEQQKFEEALADSLIIKEIPKVFQSVSSSNIPYITFKSAIELDGLNFDEYGKVSQFNQSLYESIQTAVKAKNKGFFGKSIDDEEDSVKIHAAGLTAFVLLLLLR